MAFKHFRSEPLTEKEKAHLRRSRGIKSRFAADQPVSLEVKRSRDYLAPVKSSYVPAKPKGSSGCRLSPAKRSMVDARKVARVAFFSSLGVRV